MALSKQHEMDGDGAVPEPYVDLPTRTDAAARRGPRPATAGKAESRGPVEPRQLDRPPHAAVRARPRRARRRPRGRRSSATAYRGWNDAAADARRRRRVRARRDRRALRPRARRARRALHGRTGRAACGRAPDGPRRGRARRRGCPAPNRSSSSRVATSSCCTARATSPRARGRRPASSPGRCRSPGAPRVLHVPWSGHGMLLRARLLAPPHRRVRRRHRRRRAVHRRSSSRAPPGASTARGGRVSDR